MKLTRRVLSFSIVLALSITVAWAVDFTDGLIARDRVIEAARAVTHEAYPNADDVVVDEYIRVQYQTNGTSQTWDDEYIKVLTEKGKRSRGNLSLNYTLPYGTAEVKRLEVIKPDGKVIAVDIATQSRVMVDRSQMSANIYNPNDKILKVTVPGLEIGDICHIISYRDTVKPRVPNTWSDYMVFEYTSPLKHITYEVLGPRELPLHNIALRDEIPGTVTYTSGGDENGNRYQWEIRDVPRMFAEPQMPPLYTVVQRLLISTIPDWEAISRWYWELSKPHLDAVVPEMKTKVDELTDGITDRRQRIERIFQFVSQQIRYMGITTETEAPGYEPHDVKVTFQNRYGVCRDKAALLVSMLRMADVPAYPVLIHTGPRKDEGVPQPYFNHAIVAAEAAEGDGAEYILMDPTDENTTDLLPAYLCNKSFLVAHPEGRELLTSAIVPATENLMRIRSAGTLDEYGTLEIESTLQFDGINDNAYRGYFSSITPLERKRYFEGRIKDRVPGAKVTEIEILPDDMQDTSVPLQVRLRYETQDYPIKGRELSMLALPWMGTGIGYANFVLGATGLEKRKYPLLTRIACGIDEEFTLNLGSGLGVPVSIPGYDTIETNTLSFVPRLSLESNVLHGSGTFLLEAVEFSPAEYLVLKQALKDIEFSQRKQPVFRSAHGDAAEHDVRILNDELTIELKDARNWTRTRTVKKQVLTYAGKKQHSELKFNYNPAWTEVEIARGVVTNLDGTVHEVVEEEINLMDAGWVGSAPRYPAEKTIVVSLPGVEVGSVIEYSVVQKMKGVPFFSLNHAFGGFDPVDSAVLRLRAPASLALDILDRTDDRVSCRRTQEKGTATYEWTAEQQPPVKREDALPPWWTFNPSVFVSTGDWKAYAAEVRAALEAAVTGQKSVAGKAGEITAHAATPLERVRAIRDYVAETIRPAGPGLADLPLSSVTPADRTLAEGYGNTADRAILLYTMAEAAGLAPRFVLVSSWGPRVETARADLLQCAQHGLFDVVLVMVDIDGETIALNDSDQYGELGATALDGSPGLHMDGRSFVVHAAVGMEDRDSIDYRIDVAENGDALITISQKYFGTGYASFRKKFSELPPEERNRFFQELVATVSQAAEEQGDLVTEYDTYPGRQAFTVAVPRFAVHSDGFLYLTLPGTGGSPLGLRADRRENPLYRNSRRQDVTRYTIVLPETTRRVELMPGDLQWTGPNGLGEIELSTDSRVAADGRRIIEVSRAVRLQDAVIPAEHYPALLNLDRQIKHPSSRTILVSFD